MDDFAAWPEPCPQTQAPADAQLAAQEQQMADVAAVAERIGKLARTHARLEQRIRTRSVVALEYTWQQIRSDMCLGATRPAASGQS